MAGSVTVFTHVMPVGLQARLSGILSVDDGCLKVNNLPVIWPTGTEWDISRQAVTLSQAGRAYTIALGGPLPKLAGGGMPLDVVSEYLDSTSLRALTRCLGPHGSKVLVVG